MAEKKRKTREDTNNRRKSKPEKKRKQFQYKNLALETKKKKKNNKKDERRKSGPRLPSALRRELDVLNPNPRNSDEEIDEPMPGEDESKKNRQFDPFDNLEYELPEKSEDENVQLEDNEDGNKDNGGSEKSNRRDNSDQSGDEVERGNERRHVKMLQGITTGMPADTFEGKERKKKKVPYEDSKQEIKKVESIARWIKPPPCFICGKCTDRGARLVAAKRSAEEKDCSNLLARHHSFFCCCQKKAKPIKKIKSKTGHREHIASIEKKYCKWSVRILKHGLKTAKDDKARALISKKLLQYAAIYSSDEDEDDEDDDEFQRLMLCEYKDIRDLTDDEGSSSVRRRFGAAKKQSDGLSYEIRSNSIGRDSDSEEDGNAGSDRNIVSQKDVHIDPVIHHEDNDIGQEPMFKSSGDIVGDPGPKTMYEAAILASNPRKKVGDEDFGSESGEDMVDGILSSGSKADNRLPSQADLIDHAFADDEEFEKDKLIIMNEENPEPEKPVLIPGGGQCTRIQKKKGLPSWMLEEHGNGKLKREDSLENGKDSHLKHVIISKKIDEAEKLHSKTVPFPYTHKDVFEQSVCMPIGPEFNPAASVGALVQTELPCPVKGNKMKECVDTCATKNRTRQHLGRKI
ncbi:Small-subunit processome [Macleaya cordata]|uniref:Small-subunit processome n=1 Tax=Macleaya cordata TaxID=56857 RepID=A0A200QB14_MACCD|nr:Small-subunit processome [Macleaya cordata]